MKFTKLATISVFAALYGTTFGAGFQVLEQGASNMGTSMAGAVTNANNDASAAFNNPSAFAFSDLEVGKTSVSMGMSLVVPTLGLSSTTTNKDYDCAVISYVPNFYFAHKFTDDLAVTLSVTAPFGLESDYEDNFANADQGLNSYLFTVDVNPSLVYKVNDWLSINGGVSAQYAYCRLTNAIPLALQTPFGGEELKLSGSNWGVGGNIGFTVEYMEGGRFGFHWRSAVQQDLSGTSRVDGVERTNIDASVEMPDTFTFGIYQKLPGYFDNFAIMIDYSYVRWSTFEKLVVTGVPVVGMTSCEENWKDTSRVSFGVHYQPEDLKKLLLRAGIAYDESPVQSAVDRTVRIPCSDRLWYSIGAGYQLADNISLDLAYVYIMTIGNSEINRQEYPTNFGGSRAQGHYYGHIHVVSAQINFTF